MRRRRQRTGVLHAISDDETTHCNEHIFLLTIAVQNDAVCFPGSGTYTNQFGIFSSPWFTDFVAVQPPAIGAGLVHRYASDEVSVEAVFG